MISGIGFKTPQQRKWGKIWEKVVKVLVIVELSDKLFIIWFLLLLCMFKNLHIEGQKNPLTMEKGRMENNKQG